MTHAEERDLRAELARLTKENRGLEARLAFYIALTDQLRANAITQATHDHDDHQ